MNKYFVTLDPAAAQKREGEPILSTCMEQAAKKFIKKNAPPALPILPRQCREITAYVWRSFSQVYALRAVATTITRGQKQPKVTVI